MGHDDKRNETVSNKANQARCEQGRGLEGKKKNQSGELERRYSLWPGVSLIWLRARYVLWPVEVKCVYGHGILTN